MGTKGFNSMSIREDFYKNKENELDLMGKFDERKHISDVLLLS